MTVRSYLTLATVIVCGLMSSTALTLFVVPVMYRIAKPSLPSRTSEDDDLAIAGAPPGGPGPHV